MQIYLPIAGIPVDVFLILILSCSTGVLSGMFGIGGGFLMTPILIFLGIPPAISVASSCNQIIASSFSGFLAHYKRGNVDITMGIFLTIGGTLGSVIGIMFFNWLNKIGQIDLVIQLCYVFFLGSIGIIMFYESISKIIEDKILIEVTNSQEIASENSEQQDHRFANFYKKLNFLPGKIHFEKSEIKFSFLIPMFIGFISGILVSIMGIGGGFIMMPAMIYLLGMKTVIAIGTSLFQIVFVTSFTTLMHSITSHSVDIILSFLMIFGATFGAQIGSILALKISATNLRAALSIIVLIVVGRLALNLITEPENPFMVVNFLG